MEVIMYLTLELEDSFIDTLKKEFDTPNVKDAIYTLYASYKKVQNPFALEPINTNESDYGYILDARKARQNGEKLYSIDDIIQEL